MIGGGLALGMAKTMTAESQDTPPPMPLDGGGTTKPPAIGAEGFAETRDCGCTRRNQKPNRARSMKRGDTLSDPPSLRKAARLTAEDVRRHTERGERAAAIAYEGTRAIVREHGRGAIAREDRDWFTHLGDRIVTVPLFFRSLSFAMSLPDTSSSLERNVLHPISDELMLWRGWPTINLESAWDVETTTQGPADVAVRRAAVSGSLADIDAAYKMTDRHVCAAMEVKRVLWFMRRVALNAQRRSA